MLGNKPTHNNTALFSKLVALKTAACWIHAASRGASHQPFSAQQFCPLFIAHLGIPLHCMVITGPNIHNLANLAVTRFRKPFGRFIAQCPFLPHTKMTPTPKNKPKRNVVKRRHTLLQSWPLMLKTQTWFNLQGQLASERSFPHKLRCGFSQSRQHAVTWLPSVQSPCRERQAKEEWRIKESNVVHEDLAGPEGKRGEEKKKISV